MKRRMVAVRASETSVAHLVALSIANFKSARRARRAAAKLPRCRHASGGAPQFHAVQGPHRCRLSMIEAAVGALGGSAHFRRRAGRRLP